MPSFGHVEDVVTYLDDIYAYLKAARTVRSVAAGGAHRQVRRLALLALLLAASAPTHAEAQTGDLVATDALRVCADPANLPFSNERGEGFENRIATLLGKALDRRVDYVFFPQVQGFVRNTLRAGRCDLVMGTVAGDELMQNTNPYYHTTLCHRLPPRSPGAGPPGRPGDEGAAARRHRPHAAHRPAAAQRADRQLPLLPAGRRDSGKPRRDLCARRPMASWTRAPVWGPIAGYQAKVRGLPLAMRALPSEPGVARMDFRITMGVRGEEPRMAPPHQHGHPRPPGRIDGILRDYGVPLLDAEGRLQRREAARAGPRFGLGHAAAGRGGWLPDGGLPRAGAGPTCPGPPSTRRRRRCLFDRQEAIWIDVLPARAGRRGCRPTRSGGRARGSASPAASGCRRSAAARSRRRRRPGPHRAGTRDTGRPRQASGVLLPCRLLDELEAAKRAAAWGWRQVLWYREGTDGWEAAGLPTQELQPAPGWR